MDKSNKKKHVFFSEDQNRYASLIKKIAYLEFYVGQRRKLLKNILTIEGIPFWDIFSAELSWRHLTTAVNAKSIIQKIKLLIKPFYLDMRRKFFLLKFKNECFIPDINLGDKKTILCLGLTQRMYRDILDPVLKQILSLKNVNIIVIGDHFDYSIVDKSLVNKIHILELSTYWSKDLSKKYKDLEKKTRDFSAVLNINHNINHPALKNHKYMLFPVKRTLNLLVKGLIPEILSDVTKAKSILDIYRPNIIISADPSDSKNRLYSFLGLKNGISSVNIQFGMIGDESVEYRFPAANLFCLWGITSKRALQKQNVPESKIIVTGSPRHDFFYSNQNLDRLSTLKSLNIDEKNKKKIILLASTYSDIDHAVYTHPEVLISMKKAIFDSAKEFTELLILVKPHPSESVSETKELAGIHDNIKFVEKNVDMRNLILICDAFVSFGSTATIDALIAKKLSICPSFPGWPFSESFRESKCVLLPEKKSEIRAIFSQINAGIFSIPSEKSTNSLRRKYLSNVAFKQDGRAANRIAKIILSAI